MEEKSGGKAALSESARKVLEKRYLKRDDDGKVIETPEELFHRVASNIATADKYYGKTDEQVARAEREFFDMMANLEFLPNSPTLMNAGRDLQQLSACFVLSIDDSMESIFGTIKDTALIHKSGGGTGFSFSRLRAKNSPVRSTGGISSGPVSFMKVFNSATQAVKQGGTRRGANMGILRVDHPDIIEFVTCKESDKEITNFNISVAITEDFIKRAIKGEDYDLIDPHTKKCVQKLNARKVLDLIIRMAWKNGEPGIVFIDRINRDNPTPKAGEIESTNPCGEQPLLPYESCNLGSINLARMISSGEIDWKKLGNTVIKAVHFLDNVIDMNCYPLKRIEDTTKSNRKIGLGVMGFADMLLMLGVSYDSENATQMAEKIMKFILETSQAASRNLAAERGAFQNFRGSIYDVPGARPLRNATLTTIAPTGTLSIIANCSSGIEPVFAISYIRNILDNTKFVEVHPYFEEVAEKRSFYSTELMNIIAEKGTVRGLDQVPEDAQKLFVTAHDIEAVWHIKMQAAFQKYTNNAVSKTVNLPTEATTEDVYSIYMLAYETGCKGVTIYRDKSREEQVLNISGSAAPDIKAPSETKIVPRPRPNVITGTTTKIATGCGNLYVTINVDEKSLPFELFTSMGKAGGCAMSQLEAIGRLVSLAFRSGIDTNSIIEQLRGIRCPSPSWEKGGRIFSCSDAIARVIERRMQDEKAKKAPETDTAAPQAGQNSAQIASEGSGGVAKARLPEGAMSGGQARLPGGAITGGQAVKSKTGNIVGVCPDCGSALWHVEGCMICKSCGYSKCG
ncbi:MAG: vitamin B12-dependent ribonucleotide reductase [Candidatus Omnitrophota bacterium]